MRIPRPNLEWPPRAKPAAVVLFVLAVLVVIARLSIRNAELDVWTPNVVVGLIAVAATITLVDGILKRETIERVRDRVVQALGAVSGNLHVLADFVLWDYVDMHPGDSYQRPPAELRVLLAHWKAGLDTKEVAWPGSPRILVASQTIARTLEEQMQRHERVLEDTFVAASYRYIRGELMSRNMYLDPRRHHDEDAWKTTAIGGIADEVMRLLDVFEPYARRYLGQDWTVTLREDELDGAEFIRRSGSG